MQLEDGAAAGALHSACRKAAIAPCAPPERGNDRCVAPAITCAFSLASPSAPHRPGARGRAAPRNPRYGAPPEGVAVILTVRLQLALRKRRGHVLALTALLDH